MEPLIESRPKRGRGRPKKNKDPQLFPNNTTTGVPPIAKEVQMELLEEEMTADDTSEGRGIYNI